MSVFAFLLIALGIGIFIAIKSKKLSVPTFLFCAIFGLLFGGTPMGRAINRFLLDTTRALIPGITDWLQ